MNIEAINKLFDNATPDADGNLLLECVVLIRGAAQAVQGVLSRTRHGDLLGLKLLSKVGDSDHGIDRIDHFIEQYFDYSDVALIGVQRDVAVIGGGSRGRVITGAADGFKFRG